MSFENWTIRRAGGTPPTYVHPQHNDEGYYRKAITEPMMGKDGKPNGRKRVINWIPVGYFLTDPEFQRSDGPQEIYCLMGIGDNARPIYGEAALNEELWSYVCRDAISYETWVAVAEEGNEWPDLPQLKDLPLTREAYRAAIDEAIVSLPKGGVTSKDEAETALGIKNTIAELRIEADKMGKAIYDPLYIAYQREQKPWAAMVKDAKAAEDRIRLLVDSWSETERQRMEKEKLEIEARLAAEEGRNARAADRAIARGEPEALELDEIELPGADPTPLKPSHGRAYRQELKDFVIIQDEAEVAAYFRGNGELREVLQRLAERHVKQGLKVPGTTVERRYA